MSFLHRRSLRDGLAAFVVCGALGAIPALAGAATFTVNTTADNPPTVGPTGECEGAPEDCSLRQALERANEERGENTIVLPAGTYELTIPTDEEDHNSTGDLGVEGAEVTIEGAGARDTVISAAPIEDRVLHIKAGSSLTLSGVTVTGGNSVEEGGGILGLGSGDSLVLAGVAVVGNKVVGQGARGGGVLLDHGNLTVLDSAIADNRSQDDGGGLASEGNEETIENSTIADNVVDTTGNPAEAEGAYAGGMEAWEGTFVMKNVTIAGNEIIDGNGGELGDGAGFEGGEYASSEIANVIIADNVGTEVNETGQCFETLPSAGHNLETEEPAGEARCFEEPTDLIADPLLGELADNGGETDTMALEAGSPAIDAGDETLCLATDQRGVTRPVGAGCDIGAFEWVEPAPEDTNNPGTGDGSTKSTSTSTSSVTSSTATVTTTKKVTSKKKASRSWLGIKKAQRFPSTGVSALGIKFHTAGTVSVSGPGVKAVSTDVKAGLRYIRLTPQDALAATLGSRGWGSAKVTVTFTPTGFGPITKTHTVAFRLTR